MTTPAIDITFRIGSFDPSSSCRHRFQSVCIAWWGSAYELCTRNIPYEAQSSWWSWPSYGEWAWIGHQNLAVFGRNDDGPGRRTIPCPSCIGSLCAGCASCICPCRRFVGSLGRWPFWKRVECGWSGKNKTVSKIQSEKEWSSRGWSLKWAELRMAKTHYYITAHAWDN